jgi:hypothetical protein
MNIEIMLHLPNTGANLSPLSFFSCSNNVPFVWQQTHNASLNVHFMDIFSLRFSLESRLMAKVNHHSHWYLHLFE